MKLGLIHLFVFIPCTSHCSYTFKITYALYKWTVDKVARDQLVQNIPEYCLLLARVCVNIVMLL